MRNTWKLLAISLLGTAVAHQLPSVTAQQPSEALVLPQEPISEPSVFKTSPTPASAIPSAVIRPIGPRSDFPISVAAQPTIESNLAPVVAAPSIAQVAEPIDDQAPPVPKG